MSWKRIYLAESLRKSFFRGYMNPNARNLLLYVADEGLARLFLSESFLRRKCFFQCAGEANAGTQEQLKSFFHTLRRYDSLYANGFFFDIFFVWNIAFSSIGQGRRNRIDLWKNVIFLLFVGRLRECHHTQKMCQ